MPAFERSVHSEASAIAPTMRRKSRRHHRDDSAAAARRRRSRSASPPPSRALRGLGISYDGTSSQDGDIDEETVDSPAPATRYASAGPRHGSAPRGTATSAVSGSTPASWQAAMAHRPNVEVIEWEAPTFRSRPTLPPLTPSSAACCPRPRPFAAPSSGGAAAAAAAAAAASTRPLAPTTTPLRRTSEIHLRGSTFTIFLPTPSAQLRLFQALLSAAVHYSALARRRSDAAAESDRRARERWVRRGCYCGRCARCAREEEMNEGDGEGEGEEGEVTVEEREEMEEGAMRLGHLTSLVRRACDLDTTTTVPKPTTTTTATSSSSIVSSLLYSTMVNWLRACLRAERDWKAALELQEDEQRRVLRNSRVGRCEPREAILIVKRRQDLRALRDVALFTTDIIRLLQAEQDVLCPPPSYPQTASSPGEASSASSSPSSSLSSISTLDLPPSYDDVAATAAPQRAARQPRARASALDEWLDEEHHHHQDAGHAATPRTPRLPTCWAFEPLPRHILEG